jgi:predicted nucleic acid-binding protein
MEATMETLVIDRETHPEQHGQVIETSLKIINPYK